MNKILLIIKREYLTRVKKKSFLVMTLVGPVLMAALILAPVWISTLGDDNNKDIVVIDKTNIYEDVIKDSETLHFKFINMDYEDLKANFESFNYHAVLLISEDESEFTLYSNKQVEPGVGSHIEKQIEKYKELQNLEKLGVNKSQLDSAKVDINISTIKWTEEGEEKTSPVLAQIIGFIAAIIIYMFIFMYGVQVMRGVIEEKSSRIVEVIISSVKPFQLMTGKIFGVALVALTQFLLWIILTFSIIFAVQTFMPGIEQDIAQNSVQMEQMGGNNIIAEILPALMNYNWTMLLSVFVFFFIGGYLLYSSLFAAIGAAVDNETDTQQFMLPVTIPLILAFVVAQTIVQNPSGSLAFWFSIIPFTSPIIMPVRVAMEAAPLWEILLSSATLILSFLGTVWLASKIYRVGILMYGKKTSYKELWKWIRY